MQPFNLDKSNIEESFRDCVPDWEAGMFEYELQIHYELSTEEKDTLCEWLCRNCKENFIVMEKINNRLAGGSSNNLVDWQNRQSRGIYSNFDSIHVVHVRLHTADLLLFRMVWIQ